MKPSDKAIDAAALAIQQHGPESHVARLIAQVALHAAYTAQFHPSDEYAGLVERLNILDGNETQWSAVWEIAEEAADALEALLAERDALLAVNAELSVAFKERDEAIAERDALKADLASARDMTWFWEIVDAAGLNNVASFEQTALRELVRDSAILNGLKAQFGDIGKGDGQFTVKSTFQSLLNVIDFNVELAGKLTAAEKERDAALAEIDAISSAIKPPRYMDPPDGDSVTIAEQVSRVWEDNETLRAERDVLLARLAPLEAIESDKDDPTREYIPLPGGWEIQTKGKGSSYRLLNKKTGERHMILAGDAPFVEDFVTRMAKEINASAQVRPVAPVCDEVLVEIVARRICLERAAPACCCKNDGVCKAPVENLRDHNATWMQARAAIAAVRPHIEAVEREMCAKIADDCDKSTHPADVAAAIRRGE